ncbi:MAG: PAS domain S-box protein [Xenococcaceae cyanobacterium MO_188.B32]|nr:PAS domain S-box protein [Xenococcaceae cyanobacterium MO_188.B32]
MAREVGAADYLKTNRFRQEIPERALDRAMNFFQSLSINNPIEQQDRQFKAKVETGLNYQLPAQQISQRFEENAQSISSQTKDNFQTIFEQANIGIAFIATSGQFLRVNSYLCSLLQYSESVMCSSTWQEITHTEDRETVWHSIKQVLSSSQSSQVLEQRYLRQDGQWQWVSITFSLVENSQNVPLYLIATIQDIQLRKQTEAKLRNRFTIDTAIAKISRKLISTKEINYEEILGIIGEATDCDRVSLIRFTLGYQCCSTYHWSKNTKISQLQSQITAIHQLPWWQAKLNRDEDIIINDIAQLSEVAQQEKNILRSINICSALIIPIFTAECAHPQAPPFQGGERMTSSGQVWGTLGLYDRAQNYRDWSEEDARQLRVLGAIIQSNHQYRVAQTRLKASKALSAQFFHHSVDGIFLIDRLPDGRLIYKANNPAYAKLIGKTAREIECKTIAEVFPAEIAPFVEQKCRFCLATKKPLDFLLTLELQGKTRYWRIYLVPIENYSGHYLRLQGSVKDITEEKQALDRQTRYRHLLRSITFKTSQSLDIQEILQTTVGELQKTFNADRVLLLQFLPDGSAKVIKESVESGFPSILEEVITDQYCRDVWPDKYSEGYAYLCEDTNNAELSSCHRAFLEKYQIKADLVLPISRYLPHKNSTVKKASQISNSLWGLLCVQQCSQSRQWTQDEIELLQHLVGQLTIALSQAELLESEITQRKELARSNAELEQFAYIASHDLQAPLQTVTNYVQLLQRRYQDRLDASGEKFIHYITDGVNRMRTQINDLLEYSRVGRQRSTFRTTDCNLVLEQAIANLRSEIDKHQAVVTYCSNLPTLIADSSQLVVLFQNLISNAIKYHSQAIPSIKINAERQGDYWQFSVNDNGIGIAPQYKQRIFQIFQRLHTREEYPGTGIGLAICQKIVERHGGQIEVNSQLNKGSTFYFTIPV